MQAFEQEEYLIESNNVVQKAVVPGTRKGQMSIRKKQKVSIPISFVEFVMV
jgi:hypothetical protein